MGRAADLGLCLRKRGTMEQTIMLRDEFIKLGQALKAAHLVQSGVEAKEAITAGQVTVNGQVDLRRGRKLYDQDVVSYKGNTVRIVK